MHLLKNDVDNTTVKWGHHYTVSISEMLITARDMQLLYTPLKYAYQKVKN
jgi:hypothetical protein